MISYYLMFLVARSSLVFSGFGLKPFASVFQSYSSSNLKTSRFCDPMDVGSLTAASPAFSKSRLNIWKFLVHVLLKSQLENFEHYFASV